MNVVGHQILTQALAFHREVYGVNHREAGRSGVPSKACRSSVLVVWKISAQRIIEFEKNLLHTSTRRCKPVTTTMLDNVTESIKGMHVAGGCCMHLQELIEYYLWCKGATVC